MIFEQFHRSKKIIIKLMLKNNWPKNLRIKLGAFLLGVQYTIATIVLVLGLLTDKVSWPAMDGRFTKAIFIIPQRNQNNDKQKWETTSRRNDWCLYSFTFPILLGPNSLRETPEQRGNAFYSRWHLELELSKSFHTAEGHVKKNNGRKSVFERELITNEGEETLFCEDIPVSYTCRPII